MSSIDLNSIMAKVQSYAKSPQGKRRMADKIEEYRHADVEKTEAGSHIMTPSGMRAVASQLIEIMKKHAGAAALPESVRSHFESLTYDAPMEVTPGSSWRVKVFFGDDLSRMSLLIVSGSRKGERTGEGVRDIVSLFDTGYDAGSYVYGVWDGHGEDGIRSRKWLAGRRFLESAVAEFNISLGKLYNVTAMLE